VVTVASKNKRCLCCLCCLCFDPGSLQPNKNGDGGFGMMHFQVKPGAYRVPPNQRNRRTLGLDGSSRTVASAPHPDPDKLEEFVVDCLPANPMRPVSVQKCDLNALVEGEAGDSTTCSETKSISDGATSWQGSFVVDQDAAGDGQGMIDNSITSTSRALEDGSIPSQVDPVYNGASSSRNSRRQHGCDFIPIRRDDPGLDPHWDPYENGSSHSRISNRSYCDQPQRSDRRHRERQGGFRDHVGKRPPVEAYDDASPYYHQGEDRYADPPQYDQERYWHESRRHEDSPYDGQCRRPPPPRKDRHAGSHWQKQGPYDSDSLCGGSRYNSGDRSVVSRSDRSRYDEHGEFDQRSRYQADSCRDPSRQQGLRNGYNEDRRQNPRRWHSRRHDFDRRSMCEVRREHRDYDDDASQAPRGSRCHRGDQSLADQPVAVGGRHPGGPSVVSIPEEVVASRLSNCSYDTLALHPSDQDKPIGYHTDRPRGTRYDGDSSPSCHYPQRHYDRVGYEDARSRRSCYDVDQDSIATYYSRDRNGHSPAPSGCSDRGYGRDNPFERRREDPGRRHSCRHQDHEDRRGERHEDPSKVSGRSRDEDCRGPYDRHEGGRHQRRPEGYIGDRSDDHCEAKLRALAFDIRRDSGLRESAPFVARPDGSIGRLPATKGDIRQQVRPNARNGDMHDDNLYQTKLRAFYIRQQGRPKARNGDWHDDNLYQAKLRAFGIRPEGEGITESPCFMAAAKCDGSSAEGEIYLDIGFGTKARLRTAKETIDAIARDHFAPSTCFACSSELFCIADVQFFVCPKCKTVSLAEQTECEGRIHASLQEHSVARRDVGLGFTYDTLFEMQSAVLRERGQL
jgi:hypothetical protein